LCGGSCVPACSSGMSMFIPNTCQCCTRNGNECDLDGDCCSNMCDGATSIKRCQGVEVGHSCTFHEQCEARTCANGSCVCPSGSAPCGGQCWSPCPGNTFYLPVSCRCCIANGGDCSVHDWACCAGDSACTGPGDTCVGRVDGAGCQSTAQCADSPCIGGICGGQFG
jgi:hypothetical protein